MDGAGDRDGASPTPLSRQASFMLAALSVMLCMVLAGGHLIVRALTRELRVSRLQSDFVSAVSHEFRTPLTTVRHLSQLLARGRVASDVRRAEFYGILVRESDRLQRLVENLLDFARVESGEVAYRFEAIAPGPFIRDVVNDFSGELADPAARVSIDGDQLALPAIRADRDMLARVFWNLLDNAVKYSGGTPDCPSGTGRRGGACDGESARSRHGHSRHRAVADLRQVRSRRCRARRQHQGHGHRPGDIARNRPRARRRHHGAERNRARQHVRGVAAGGCGPAGSGVEPMATSILIVEDDPGIIAGLREDLTYEGYGVRSSRTATRRSRPFGAGTSV